MTDPGNLQSFHPFTRLNRLLADTPAGRSPIESGAPLALSVGEPKGQPPAFVAEVIAEHAADWSRYPPPRGTSAFLAACGDWLERRYDLPAGLLDAERHILPLPGSREGLFFAALAVVSRNRDRTPGAVGRPAVLIPNPFYHVYAGAALAAGAEPVFVPATAGNGFLPDYAGLPAEILARTALCILCSPANPQGSVAGRDQLKDLIRLARRHDFVVAFDECYAEIYDSAPPPGALDVVGDLAAEGELGAGPDEALDRVLVFHSLSKRSSAPGLRCGFVAGDAALVEAIDLHLRIGGAGVPLPVLAAATRLWRDEDHVEANRALYRANFAAAAEILGSRFGARTPAGGFFLWLDVGDGEKATVTLWREAGLRVLPGAYMSVPDDGGRNPGAPYIRVALVYDPEVTKAALGRMADIL